MGPKPTGWLGGLICVSQIFLPSLFHAVLIAAVCRFWDSGERFYRRAGRCNPALPLLSAAAVVGCCWAALYNFGDERDMETAARFRDRHPGACSSAFWLVPPAGRYLWRRRRHLSCLLLTNLEWLKRFFCFVSLVHGAAAAQPLTRCFSRATRIRVA